MGKKPENLKQGEYFGYYDKTGKWVTGQNGPNTMSEGDAALVAKWHDTYGPGKLFTKTWFKAVGNDILFALGLKN